MVELTPDMEEVVVDSNDPEVKARSLTLKLDDIFELTGTSLDHLGIFVQIYKRLIKHGFDINTTLQYYQEYVDEIAKRNLRDPLVARRADIYEENLPECSCGEKMDIVPIKLEKGKSNVYGWKSVAQCRGCEKEEFSKISYNKRVDEILKPLRDELAGVLTKHGIPKEMLCPECKALMAVGEIAQPTTEGWRSVWACGSCGYKKFSKNPMPRLKGRRKAMSPPGRKRRKNFRARG